MIKKLIMTCAFVLLASQAFAGQKPKAKDMNVLRASYAVKDKFSADFLREHRLEVFAKLVYSHPIPIATDKHAISLGEDEEIPLGVLEPVEDKDLNQRISLNDNVVIDGIPEFFKTVNDALNFGTSIKLRIFVRYTVEGNPFDVYTFPLVRGDEGKTYIDYLNIVDVNPMCDPLGLLSFQIAIQKSPNEDKVQLRLFKRQATMKKKSRGVFTKFE